MALDWRSFRRRERLRDIGGLLVGLPLVSVPERFVSFVNAPVVTDLDTLDADVPILGVPYGIPYEMGQSRSFSAPAHVRQYSGRFTGVVGAAEWDRHGGLRAERGARIVDCGDVPGDPMDIRGAVDRATRAVRAILDRGAVPIAIGGDDAVPIPIMRAYEGHGPVFVVQFDQHLDFGDEVRGVREGYCSPIRRIREMPWVSGAAQIGLQGSSAAWAPPGEAPGVALCTDSAARPAAEAWPYAPARDAGNILVSSREVHDLGAQAILDRIPAGADYFITFDVDAWDAAVCPAMSHPEPGGLTFWESVDLVCGLARRGRVVGMDLVEMVPDHDLHGLGARTAGRLIINLVAAMAEAGQFRRSG